MALWGFVVLAALGAVLAAVLATPLHLALSLDSATAEGRLSLRPLWGRAPAVRLPLRLRQQPHTRRPLAWPRIASLRGLIDRIHIDALSLDLSFGTGDPAETGQLYGGLTALAHLLPGGTGAVRLQPDFATPGLAGRGEARLHFTPLALVLPGLRLARDLTRRRP